jgi:hypothetical protein
MMKIGILYQRTHFIDTMTINNKLFYLKLELRNLKYSSFKSFHILLDIDCWFDVNAIYSEHGVWGAVNCNTNSSSSPSF